MGDDETIQFPQSDATTGFGVAVRSKVSSGNVGAAGASAALQPGAVLGGRYEILQMLGEGGMGAVYKARDKAVDRLIALKIIRPDLVGNEAILQRFKQELILARQITHRNVIRIYDLGEADGLMFITMEYVEGQDLRSVLKDHGKLPSKEATEVVLQILGGLQAAHVEGVIHRDLKPGNIMRDPQGRIIVMDFGLARTLGGDGMTQTGMMLGTIEYMSPEQAQAKELDARSDLFTVGLIFYELLTGETPFRAETALASLVKRTQERAVAVSTIEPTVDRKLSAIIGKCLEREPAQRYQNAQEIMNDLEAWKSGKAAVSLGFPSLGTWGRDIRWEWIAVALAVVVLAVGGIFVRGKLSKAPAKTDIVAPAGPEVSLAILPFRNASGDTSLDWLGPSLAEMLTTDVGQSAHLRTVSPNRLHQILGDLKISATTVLDPGTIKRVADSSSADRVVSGQYAKFGDQIRIDATLQDLKNDRTLPLKVDVASEKEIPGAIDKLADSIRQSLALSPDLIKELKASSFQPSSKSVDALKNYNRGVTLLRDGKNLDAQKQFEDATKADPAFALAFSKLAQTYSSLGYDGQAEQAAQKSVELSDNLPHRERYLILANQARIQNDTTKAIQYYENLVKVSPEDQDVQFTLGSLYESSGNFDKARQHYDLVLQRDPQNMDALLAVGRIENRNGNTQKALDNFNRVMSLAVQVGNDEEKAAALQAVGVTYTILNKPEEALKNYQESLAIKRRIGQQKGVSVSLNQIANAQIALGKPQLAMAAFQESLDVSRNIGDKRGTAKTLIDFGSFIDDHGDHDKALKLFKEALPIERDLGNETMQAICLNDIGTVYFNKGQYEDALTYFQQSVQLREKTKAAGDITDSLHNVGDTEARLGSYSDAVSQYMRALDLRRGINDTRGAALESYSLGTVFDYQGRYGAALSSKLEAVKTLQDLKEKGAWMPEVLAGYGRSLVLAGRGDEAKTYLDNALTLARELKNESLISQALAAQGDATYYRGDAKSAQGLYSQALQSATRSKEPDKILVAKVDLAMADIQQGRGKAAIGTLKPLVQQADDLGLKYTALESSIAMADAMIQSHDFVQSRQVLDGALLRTNKLGLQPLTLKAHYLLATMWQNSGNKSEAQDQYRSALHLLDSMAKEPGAEKIKQRADLKAINDAATAGMK